MPKLPERERASEEVDLERFEKKQVQDYFQYAYDSDTNSEADEAVKELLKLKIKVQLDLEKPRTRVVSSITGSVHRDLLVEGKVPVADVPAEIKRIGRRKLEILNRAIAGLQAVYKDRKWTWPRLSREELAAIK